MPRRHLHSVPTVAKLDLIEVGLKDLILAVMLLHFASRRLLTQLARETHVAPVDEIRVHVADELLRDGARPAPLAQEVVLDGSGNADQVDSVVLIEALILDGDERFANVRGKRRDRDAE